MVSPGAARAGPAARRAAIVAPWAAASLVSARRIRRRIDGLDGQGLKPKMLAQLKDLIPGAENWPRFLRNRSEQFEARLSLVEIVESPSLFLDGMAGLWCVNVGYGNKELINAAAEQMETLAYYNTFFQSATPIQTTGPSQTTSSPSTPPPCSSRPPWRRWATRAPATTSSP